MSLVIPVILCGGSGTRLWPLSRAEFPKQFLALPNSASQLSLLQQAVARVNTLSDVDQVRNNINFGPTIITTNEEHRFLVTDQLREITSINTTVLLEPVAKNTAPALSLAALHSSQSLSADPILVITPADQIIENHEVFSKALLNCIHVVEEGMNVIALMGITPKSAETGYGYIKYVGSKDLNNSYPVDCFVEKPDMKNAQNFLEDGHYLWNSGIFVLRASTWLSALQHFQSNLLHLSQQAWLNRSEDTINQYRFIRPGNKEFQEIPCLSIDHAVIEKCPGSRFPVRVIELDAGWSDLGAWEAVWQVGRKDADKNVVSGEVVLYDSRNCLVHSSDRLVSAVGLENIIIVETSDALLVANKARSQDIKTIVAQLDLKNNQLKDFHRKVYRPWGWYDCIDQGEGFKIKRIQVKPGASLSLQKHNYRAEHWVVVKGVAEIINGDQVITLTANQSTYIPEGQMHRLTNSGTIPLEIIEVQSGNYLGEDDIVRVDDIYGRS